MEVDEPAGGGYRQGRAVGGGGDGGGGGGPTSWRAAQYKKQRPFRALLRERCRSRLRGQRLAMLEQNRHACAPPAAGVDGHMQSIASVVTEELLALGELTDADAASLTPAERAALLDGFREAMEHELKEEEGRLISEYLARTERLEAASIQAAVAAQEFDAIICPLCQKHALLQQLSVIFCACGFRLNTEADGIALDYLRTRLSQVTDGHASRCGSALGFVLQEQFGLQSLMAHCSVCGYTEIVI